MPQRGTSTLIMISYVYFSILNNDDLDDLVNDDHHDGSDAHDDNLENYDDQDAREYEVTPSNPLLPQSMLASG